MWDFTQYGRTCNTFSISQSKLASRLPPITEVDEGKSVDSTSSSSSLSSSEASITSIFGAEGVDGLIGKLLRIDSWFSNSCGLLKRMNKILIGSHNVCLIFFGPPHSHADLYTYFASTGLQLSMSLFIRRLWW